MSLIDDLLVNAKSAANTVGEKTGELVNSAKLRMNIAEVNSELSKKYEALGKLVYNKVSDNTFEVSMVDSLAAEIKELEELLTSIKEHGDNMKTKKNSVCSACGAKLNKNALFCSICGTEIKKETN